MGIDLLGYIAHRLQYGEYVRHNHPGDLTNGCQRPRMLILDRIQHPRPPLIIIRKHHERR